MISREDFAMASACAVLLRLHHAEPRKHCEILVNFIEQVSEAVEKDARAVSVAKIDRLCALAREGWTHVREVYEGEDVEPVSRIAEALKEIEAAS